MKRSNVKKLILNPTLKNNYKNTECNMAKKVKNKDQDAHLKDIVLEVFNIAKSCKITSTPSTAHLRTTCKQGGETKGA